MQPPGSATAPAEIWRQALAAYVAEHLAGPARAIVGFQGLLVEQARESGRDDLLPDLERVSEAAAALERLISELLDAGADGGATAAERDLEEAEARLRHDLRTPLNAIIGYTEMLAEELEPDDPLAPDQGAILAEARLLLERVEEIVGLLRHAEAGGSEGVDRAAALAASLGPTEPPTPHEAPGVVLVVDDIATNRDLLARRLVRQGHRVLMAASGAEALALLDREAVDLVLLDVLMPDMSGIEVLSRIRGAAATARLPVIMISGLADTEAVIRCISAGADDYLVKPFDPVILNARVNASLERKRWADRERRYLQNIEREKARGDALLRAILPDQIVARLNDGEALIADRFEAATILFADIVGFTPIARTMPATRLVRRLDEIFRAFDALALQHGVEKIKTIGDAYMAAAGLPEHCPDHADRAVRFAWGMLETIHEVDPEPVPFQLRIGIHTGPVVAGLIGRHRFVYDVWGETVNLASRLEADGVPGAIHVSGATRNALVGEWPAAEMGERLLDGIGRIATFRIRPGTEAPSG